MSLKDTRGKEGFVKVLCDIFFKNFDVFFFAFGLISMVVKTSFLEKLECHSTPGGGAEKCHKMTHGGGGGLNSAKMCHVLFEWPLSTNNYFGVTKL